MTVRVRRVRCADEWVFMAYDATVSAVHCDVETRWWFIGASGAGKSTYARAVSNAINVPYVEMDAIFHQANWSELEPVEFRRRLIEVAESNEWVIDGNYRAVRHIVMARVQVVVMLDFSRRLVFSQVVRRTFRRALHHEELWNGNREDVRNIFRWDPHLSVIRWSWTTHATTRESFSWMQTLARQYGAVVIRVHSHEEVRRVLAEHLGLSVDDFLG